MIDPKLIRADLAGVVKNLSLRGFKLNLGIVTVLETRRKDLQIKTQELQSLRNNSSKAIGKAKASGEDTKPLFAAVAEIRDKLKDTEAELKEVQEKLEEIFIGVPNLLHSSVPEGIDENDNEVVRSWGDQPKFDFIAKFTGKFEIYRFNRADSFDMDFVVIYWCRKSQRGHDRFL